MSVQIIKSSSIIKLRHKVLRANKDIDSARYALDNNPTTFHLAKKEQNEIVCVATFYPEHTSIINAQNPYRLRGMATHPEFRRRGFASELMNAAFEHLTKLECDVLWCKARVVALDYYDFMGFHKIGDVFEIEGIGPHYHMYKLL